MCVVRSLFQGETDLEIPLHLGKLGREDQGAGAGRVRRGLDKIKVPPPTKVGTELSTERRDERRTALAVKSGPETR